MNYISYLGKMAISRVKLSSFAIMVFVLGLVACGNKNENLVHIVKKGDTLYSIARKNQAPIQQLLKLNNIHSGNVLKQGQKLVIRKKADHNKRKIQQSVRILGNTKQKKFTPILVTGSRSVASTHASNYSGGYTSDVNKNFPKISWVWPASGKIITNFTTDAKIKFNGVDIAGLKGDPILCVSDGRVVYAGNNLRGYGNLVIIKHAKDFLSAYAHNDRILVTEQQIVTKGQKIATMGSTDAKMVKLHFQIRFKGKPVDPLKFLPKYRY